MIKRDDLAWEVFEDEDVRIDPELIPDENGVTAYVETYFDVERRFDITLSRDDLANLYVSYCPFTDTVYGLLCVKRCADERVERLDVNLRPSERNMLKRKMNEICRMETGKELKELYEDWKRDYGKKEKNYSYER